MPKSIKLIAALGLFTTVAACAQQQQEEEFVVIDPQPHTISVEPVYTGKYK